MPCASVPCAWVVALLSLSACEREGEGRFTPPRVGQEQDVTTVGDYTVELPDGTSRLGTYRTFLHTTVLETSGLAIKRMRVVVLHDLYAFDGELNPVRNGIFELDTKNGFKLTKAGGEPNATEREYFNDWGPTLDRRGIRNVLERTLRVGERFVPTDEERESLGFPRSHGLVVVPREVDRDYVTFDITYDAEVGDAGVIAHSRGWLKLGAYFSEADQRADVTADGRHVGTMHWYDVRTND